MNEELNLRIEKIKEYRAKNKLPEFKNPEDYSLWLETPQGEAYQAVLENIRIEVKGRGGYRKNAGRKKLYDNRVALNKRVPSDTVVIIKDFSKNNNISENEAIVKLIQAGYQSLQNKRNVG